MGVPYCGARSRSPSIGGMIARVKANTQEEVERDAALVRLHLGPGELSHPHDVDASFFMWAMSLVTASAGHSSG